MRIRGRAPAANNDRVVIITAVRNAFTRYLSSINKLSDMARFFAVTWTLLLALSLLSMIVVGIGRLVRTGLAGG